MMKCIVPQLVISATSLVQMALCDRPIDPKYLNLKHNDGNTLYYQSQSTPHHISKSSRPIDPNSVIVNSPESSSSSSSSSPLAELFAVWMLSFFFIHLALFLISKCLNHTKFLMECVNKNKSHTNNNITSSDNAPTRDVSSISPLLHPMLSQPTTPTSYRGMFKKRRVSSVAIECTGGIGYNSEGSSAFLDYYSSGYESEVMMKGGGGSDSATSKHNVSVKSSSAFLGEKSNAPPSIEVYSSFKCNGAYARSWLPATSPNFANRTRLDVLPQQTLSFSPKVDPLSQGEFVHRHQSYYTTKQGLENFSHSMYYDSYDSSSDHEIMFDIDLSSNVDQSRGVGLTSILHWPEIKVCETV